jgi:predicted dehydrogenase
VFIPAQILQVQGRFASADRRSIIMIRVGLIGAGFMGRNHFNQYEKLEKHCRVVALCDQEPDRRAGDWSGVGGNIADSQGAKRDLSGIRQYADWHDVIADEDVDMVDLCIPTYLHAEMSIAALEAGKHVLCEKPMSLSVEDCDRMLAAASKSRGKFMIAQCIRFWPEYVFLKQAYEDGRYGRLEALQLWRRASTPDYSLNDWILDPTLSGGAALDLHVHDVDYALYLLGKPASVTARSTRRPSGALDRIHALWDYPQGFTMQVEGFWDMPPGFGFTCGFNARFEKAALYWELSSGKPLAVFPEKGEPETPGLLATDGYYNEIAYFVACAAKNEAPVTSTPAESREAVAVALAEQRSAESNAPVDIE